jgi:hypothetical protein
MEHPETTVISGPVLPSPHPNDVRLLAIEVTVILPVVKFLI